jgi:hypothetical protein
MRRTVIGTASPGDGTKAAEVVAENLRADGHTVVVGDEFLIYDDPRKAGCYAVNLTVDEQAEPEVGEEPQPEPEPTPEPDPALLTVGTNIRSGPGPVEAKPSYWTPEHRAEASRRTWERRHPGENYDDRAGA